MKRYPVLKKGVRIKKMRHFCWVMEQESAVDLAAAPIEAFILASLCGEWEPEALAYLLRESFSLPEQHADQILRETLKRFSPCIQWEDSPAYQEPRYCPGAYIYDVEPGAIRNQERLDTPAELHFSITHACNFRCIYCFNASDAAAPGELDTEQWLDLIRQAAELDVQKCTITGGEPLLHPGLLRILQALRERGLLVTLCTNGSLCPPELAPVLEGCTVQVSLDTSDRDIHARLTAGDTLGLVEANIQNFTAAGAYVQVKCVLTPLNIHTVADLYARCKGLGVRKLILDRFDVSRCGRGGDELLISESQMDTVRETVSAVYDRDAMEVRTALHPHSWTCVEDIVPCAAFRRSLIILPGGDVSACEKMLDDPAMVIGNVRDSSLADLWRSDKIDGILHPDQREMDPACVRCAHLSLCNTGCYALKSYNRLPLFGIDPRCRLQGKQVQHSPL